MNSQFHSHKEAKDRRHTSRSSSKLPNLCLAGVGAWANTSQRNMSASSPEELIKSLNSLSLKGHDGHSGPHKHGKEPDYNVTQVSEGRQRTPVGSSSVDDTKSDQPKDSTKIKAQAALTGSCNKNNIEDNSEEDEEEDWRSIRYGAPPQDFAWTHGLVPPISMNTNAAGTSNLYPEAFVDDSSYHLETTADLSFIDPSPALNHQYEQRLPGHSGFSSNTVSNAETSWNYPILDNSKEDEAAGAQHQPLTTQEASNHGPNFPTEESGNRSQSFVCPMNRMNPIRYRSCDAYKLAKPSAVKQHIERSHYQEFCATCHKTFAGNNAEKDKQRHARHGKCQATSALKIDSISNEQMGELRSRHRRQPYTGQWRAIWEVVCPQKIAPPSPYIHDKLSEQMVSFRDFLRQEGSPIICDTLQRSGWMIESDMVQSALQAAFDDLFRGWAGQFGEDLVL